MGELLRYLGKLRGGVPTERIHSLAEQWELDLDRPIRALSKGNKQKVGLIQAFMHRPRLLVLDEPTSGLDPLLQQRFLAMLRESQQDGATIFMSSHILSEVQRAADRVAILRQGRLVDVDDIASLRRRAVRQVEIQFDEAVSPKVFARLPHVRDAKVVAGTLHCTVEGSADALVKTAAQFRVLTLLSREPDLEEDFLSYYSDPDKRGESPPDGSHGDDAGNAVEALATDPVHVETR